ncbi:MAG: formate/nitrite transporter family protein [Nitrospirae bacterium]|nr:formate/nitrite transporter family protein [Nitrospirota bacterium]
MMMDDIKRVSQISQKKIAYMENSMSGYLILSLLAGIYVGFGIILIFAVGSPFAASSSAATKLVMGLSFGIALSLVIFAGSELFTGNNMFCLIGGLTGEIGWDKIFKLSLICYIGNLAGSLLLAWLVVASGTLSSPPQSDFIIKVTSLKMNLPFYELFLRGILCNWLVCLAVWTAGRTQSDSAKLILIFWCLFAFIGSGFEHSVANMTLLGIGLFLPHGDSISWFGFARNLIPVTLGNIIGGGVFVGGLYWIVSPHRVIYVEEIGAKEVSDVDRLREEEA